MEVIKNNAETAEKKLPTYNEMKQYVDNLYMQNQQLAAKLQQITNITNKIPFLFEVLKNSTHFSEEFVKTCASEIEFIMTPPADEKEDKPEENEN